MVIVELLLVASGLGRLLLEFAGRLQAEFVFATVFVVILEALLLLGMMRFAEQKMAPWAHDISRGVKAQIETNDPHTRFEQGVSRT